MGIPADPGAVVDPDALIRLRFLAAEARRRRARRTSSRPGPFVTRRRGRGSETDDVRLWSHGDDPRHVDRNATARTGEPHVRTFRDERERTTLLVADFRPAMLFGTRRALMSVAAAEILALAGWWVAAEGARVGLLALAGGEPVHVRPAVGERAMIAVVGGLVQAHRQALAGAGRDAPAIGPQLAAAARSIPSGGTLVLASGFDDAFERADAGIAAALAEALVRVDVAAAVISDAFERTAPAGVYPFVTADGRRGLGAVRGTARGAGASEATAARLAGLGVRSTVVRAEEPPAAQLAAVEALHG